MKSDSSRVEVSDTSFVGATEPLPQRSQLSQPLQQRKIIPHRPDTLPLRSPSSTSDGLRSPSQIEIEKWSTEELIQQMNSCGADENTLKLIRRHHIDGASLMSLQKGLSKWKKEKSGTRRTDDFGRERSVLVSAHTHHPPPNRPLPHAPSVEDIARSDLHRGQPQRRAVTYISTGGHPEQLPLSPSTWQTSQTTTIGVLIDELLARLSAGDPRASLGVTRSDHDTRSQPLPTIINSDTRLSIRPQSDERRRERTVGSSIADQSVVVQSTRASSDGSYRGWMKWRRMSPGPIVWHDAHFRLTGYDLRLYQSETQLCSTYHHSFDMREWRTTCESIKVTAMEKVMEALGIRSGEKPRSGVAFQMMPNESERSQCTTQRDGIEFLLPSKKECEEWARALSFATFVHVEPSATGDIPCINDVNRI